MKVKLFWKKDCPRCPQAKRLVEGFENVEFYNVEEDVGLAEASFYGVMSTPSIIVIDEEGKEASAWYGEVPPKEDLERCLYSQ